MTLKASILFFMLWKAAVFTTGNKTEDLRFLLGCQAEIPCRPEKTKDSNSFKWFYQKDERSEKIQLLFEDKAGVKRHSSSLRRASVKKDRTLVIDNFTEDAQGLYWCESCYGDSCKKSSTVLRVTKDMFKETVYVSAGSSFKYSCPGESANFWWTFNPSPGTTAFRDFATGFVTSNRTIHILKVKKADVGIYTCWAKICKEHRQNICTINLCVVTADHSGNSSDPCAVLCPMEPGYISNIISGISSALLHPNVSLLCSATQIYDAETAVSSTHAPSSTSVKTKDTHPRHAYRKAVVYGTSAAITCLILLALFFFYFRPRIRADTVDNHGDCHNNGTVESTLVYSSVAFRTPAVTSSDHVNPSDCVYSEVNVRMQ